MSYKSGKKNPNFKHDFSREMLYQKYIIENKSTNQISKELNCCKRTILLKLKKFNINTRKSSLYWINRKHSKESKLKMSLAHKGKLNSFYGKTHSIKQKNKWKQTRPSISINLWKLESYRNNQTKKYIKGYKIIKNKSEKIIHKLIGKNYIYNKTLIIDGLVPDFVNKDNNKIIEFYGSYWHKNRKADKRRIKVYKKAGYKTMIIWDYELKDLDKLKKKIKDFK